MLFGQEPSMFPRKIVPLHSPKLLFRLVCNNVLSFAADSLPCLVTKVAAPSRYEHHYPCISET